MASAGASAPTDAGSRRAGLRRGGRLLERRCGHADVLLVGNAARRFSGVDHHTNAREQASFACLLAPVSLRAASLRKRILMLQVKRMVLRSYLGI